MTSRLPEFGYEALKILSKGAREADVVRFMEEAERGGNSDYVKAVLQISIAANEELYHKLEQEGIMMGAFERVFHRELAEARDQGLSRGRDEGITIGEQRARRSIMETLIAGGMDPQKAASFTGLAL